MTRNVIKFKSFIASLCILGILAFFLEAAWAGSVSQTNSMIAEYNDLHDRVASMIENKRRLQGKSPYKIADINRASTQLRVVSKALDQISGPKASVAIQSAQSELNQLKKAVNTLNQQEALAKAEKSPDYKQSVRVFRSSNEDNKISLVLNLPEVPKSQASIGDCRDDIGSKLRRSTLEMNQLEEWQSRIGTGTDSARTSRELPDLKRVVGVGIRTFGKATDDLQDDFNTFNRIKNTDRDLTYSTCQQIRVKVTQNQEKITKLLSVARNKGIELRQKEKTAKASWWSKIFGSKSAQVGEEYPDSSASTKTSVNDRLGSPYYSDSGPAWGDLNGSSQAGGQASRGQ